MRMKNLILTCIVLTLLLFFAKATVNAIVLDGKESVGNAKETEIPKYAQGEIIIKFKSQSTLQDEAAKLSKEGKIFASKNIKPRISNNLNAQIHQKDDMKIQGEAIKAIADIPDKVKLLVKDSTTLEPVFKGLHNKMHLKGKAEYEVDEENRERLFRKGRRLPTEPKSHNLSSVYIIRNIETKGKTIEELCKELLLDPNVEYAEPNYKVSVSSIPNDPLFDKQWPLHNIEQSYPVPGGYTAVGTLDSDIDAPEAWDTYERHKDTIVAVIDTGVDYNHPDLAANMWVNQNEVPDNDIDDDENGYIDDRYGYDFINKNYDPRDDHGHGTHVSGIIAAVHNNGIGISGISPYTKIMALKFLGADGSGSVADAVDAFYYAVANGADIMSNSWGGDAYSATLQEAINYAYNLDVIVIAAAGNSSSNSLFYPAGYKNVVAVAATDSKDRKASFSNYGDWIDVSAPGVDILSLRAIRTDMYGDASRIVSNDYYIASGTSMACPHVAGVAALLVSAHPDWTNTYAENQLINAVDGIELNNPFYEGMLGSGRINVYKAMAMDPQPRLIISHLSISDNGGDGFIDPGETIEVNITLKNIWTPSYGVSVKLESDSTYINIVSGEAEYGDIDSECAITKTFSFNVSSAAPRPYKIPLTLTIHAGNIPAYTEKVILPIDIEWSLHQGWPVSGTYEWGTTKIADLNNDGEAEIVSCNYKRIDIRNQNGTRLPGMWPRSPANGWFGYLVAIGDLDGDGDKEIVASNGAHSGTCKIYAFHHDGTNVAGWPVIVGTGPIYMDDPAIMDLDKDGRDEIAINVSGKLYLYKGNGTLYSNRWPCSVGEPQACYTAAFADMDIDGYPEIIYSTSAGGVSVFDTDCNILPGWPFQLAEGGEIEQLCVGDIDKDGWPEIVFAANEYVSRSVVYGNIYVLDTYGNLKYSTGWPNKLSQHIYSLALSDLDNDGFLEILAGGNSMKVYAFRYDGRPVSGWPVMTENAPFPSANIGGIGDLDGDDYKEVLICATTGVYIFKHDGSSMLSKNPIVYAQMDRNTEFSFPSIGDIDGDGLVEVVASADEDGPSPNNSKMYVWDFSGNIANSDWPHYAHDIGNTSHYGELVLNPEAQISLDREVYSPSFFNASILLLDKSLNVDSMRVESVQVRIYSETESDGEAVLLTESTNDSGVFKGKISLSIGNPSPDGMLQVTHGDKIRVLYDTHGIREDSALVDAAGPKILKGSVRTESGFDGNRIFVDMFWLTDEVSDSKISYGIGDMTNELYDSAFVAEHRIRIYELELNKTYKFALQSSDPYKNITYDNNLGTYYNFTPIIPAGITAITVLNKGQSISSSYYAKVAVCDLKGMMLYASKTADKFGQAAFDLAKGREFLFRIDVRGPKGSVLERETTYFTDRLTAPAEMIFDIDQAIKNVRLSILKDNKPARVQLDTVGPNLESWFGGGDTDENGIITLSMPNGVTFRLHMYCEGTIYWTAPIYTSPGEYTMDILDIPPNATLLLFDSGIPVIGRWITIENYDKGFAESWALTDDKGIAGFSVLPPLGDANSGIYRFSLYDASGKEAYTKQFTVPEIGTGCFNMVYDLNPLLLPPKAPTNLQAIFEQPSQVNLTWQDNSYNEAGFTIEKSTNPTMGFTEIASIGENKTSFIDTNANPRNTLYYRVCAYNEYGHSEYTQVVCNLPPVLTLPHASLAIAEGESVQFTVIATDSNNDILTFTHPQPSELPPGASFVDNGDGTAAFSWTPAYNQARAEPYVIHFEVSDGTLPTALTDSEDVSITVNNVLVYGTIYKEELGVKSYLEGTAISILNIDRTSAAISPALTDAEGKFKVVGILSDGNYLIKIEKQGYAYSEMIFLSNNQALPFTVTLYAPVMEALSDASLQENQPFTLTISATDRNNDKLSFSATGLPDGATLQGNANNTATFSWNPTHSQSGSHTVQFKVTDGLLSDTKSATLKVNTVPELAPIGNKTIELGKKLEFTVSAIDAEGDTLIFSTDNLPVGASFDNVTHIFSWVPTKKQIGTYQIIFNVSDGKLNDSETVTVIVKKTNKSPQAIIYAKPHSGRAPLKVRFIGARSFDRDGTIVSYLWDFGDGSISAAINAIHVYQNSLRIPKVYTVTLTVVDNEKAKSDTIVRINVLPHR